MLCCSADDQLLSKYVLQPLLLLGGKEKAIVHTALQSCYLVVVNELH